MFPTGNQILRGLRSSIVFDLGTKRRRAIYLLGLRVLNRYTSMAYLDWQKSKEEPGTDRGLAREFQRMSRSFFAYVQQLAQSSGNFGVTFFEKGNKYNKNSQASLSVQYSVLHN